MTRAHIEFPEYHYSEDFREGAAIGGKFGITAVLPTIHDIREWKEGRRRFSRGYYRLVDGPDLQRLQQGLASHFGVRHALAFCSMQSALLELLELHLNRSAASMVKVLGNFLHPEYSFLIESLQSLRRPVIHARSEHPEHLEPLSHEIPEVLVLALESPLEWMEAHRDWMNSVSAENLPVVACTNSLQAFEAFPHWSHYWVSPLGRQSPSCGMRGGIVFGSRDRQMAELGEIRKKRGNILSLRHAAVLLEELKKTPAEPVSTLPEKTGVTDLRLKTGKEVDSSLVKRLCSLEGADTGFFFPSGMSAITSVLSMLRRPEKPRVIVIGLLYTDSYAFLEWPFHGEKDTTIYLQTSETGKLEKQIDERTACIFTETITNPLQQTPNLEALKRIAADKNVPLVIDNTLATPLNCRPLDWGADFVIHSTSKYLSGSNDHGGGVVMIRGKRWQQPLMRLQRQWGLNLLESEKETLAENLEDFEKRMERFNRNGEKLARFLKQHPSIARVYHGSLDEEAKASKSWLSGYGSIVCFELKSDNLDSLCLFYDHLPPPVLKAPSLGSNRTLVCPYPLLAHYHESPSFFGMHGFSRHMVRVSTGCEDDLEPVLAALDMGLKNVMKG